MGYATTTFAQAKQLLANRLGDALKVHFVDAELGYGIVEALRTWNSVALYFRDSYTQILPSQLTYNLNADFVTTLNGYTLTDRNVINQIQYNLYEPATTNWTLNTPAMTDMFSVSDLQLAIQRARDRFLCETGCVVTEYHVHNPSPSSISNGIMDLNTSVADVRRVSWQEDDVSPGPISTVWRSDEFALSAFNTSWLSTATRAVPKVWSISESAPSQIRFSPKPPAQVSRTVNYWGVSTGDPLNSVVGVNLGLPDDLAWVVRFGALYDLLSRDGQAKDPTRAEYCLQRYNEGVQIARRIWTTIEQAFNTDTGSLLPIGSIDSLDKYSPGWQNTSQLLTGKPPKSLAMIGPNIFALSTLTDGGFNITLQVVTNAVVPTSDGDYLQIGQDVLQAILDYAAHLLLFKEEGPEFFGSMDGYKNLFQMAMVHNARLRANAKYFDVLNDRGMLDEKFAKRLKEQAA